MGLLDDAIREHLELKRRRGADETEVSRQEAEALGAPQQRAEFAEAPAPAEPAAEPEEQPEPEPELVEEEPVDEIPLDQPTVEYTPEDLEPEPEPEPQPQPPAATEAAEGEDVLEETPDFLQETPEHDRLWFEQKPPRDFDLDR
jgi:hypothetical protein